jgi:hypothetical protein
MAQHALQNRIIRTSSESRPSQSNYILQPFLLGSLVPLTFFEIQFVRRIFRGDGKERNNNFD